MKFNENLKYLRKKEGLTQEELAEKLNVSRQSVTKWESGQSLPDIEKIKEIAYMLSVSVDSLIGDVESKSTNKIKKKIDDIGWFVLAFIVLAFATVSSIHNFLYDIFKNEDATITGTIMIGILIFMLFIVSLKNYLRNNEEKILNMKDDREGKKERIKHIAKKYSIILIIWWIFSFVANIELLATDKILFFNTFIEASILGTILDLVFAYINYISLEKKLKN